MRRNIGLMAALASSMMDGPALAAAPAIGAQYSLTSEVAPARRRQQKSAVSPAHVPRPSRGSPARAKKRPNRLILSRPTRRRPRRAQHKEITHAKFEPLPQPA